MGQNKRYDSAYNNYIKTINQYTSTAQKAYDPAYKNANKYINNAYKDSNKYINNAYNTSQKYVGDKGYNRALNLGKKGATSATNASIANSINSARASGMNKAQSATMGNQSAINTYNNQLNTQQSNAYASGQDATNNAYNRANSLVTNVNNNANSLATNEYNRANGISGVYGNRANLAGQAMNSSQAEGNNIFTRLFGGAGAIGNLFSSLSDERLKKYKDISTSFCTKKENDVNSILKYKINLEKYNI